MTVPTDGATLAMPMRRFLTILLVASILGPVVGPRLASGDPDPFRFPRAPSDPGTESERDPRGRAEQPPPPVADDPVAGDIRDLAQWPGTLGVRAAESLLLRGEDVIPQLVEVLILDASPSQPGAAWVLGRLGEAAHVAVILRAAARRRNGSRAEVFFEAAYDLDAKKTKDWLFSFLPLKRPVFRQKATDFLLETVGADDRRRVLRLLDAEKAGVRVAGLRLLEGAKVEDRLDRLCDALADPSPEVARAASVLLAVRSTDEGVVARLNEIAVDGLPRERAYAVLSLVEIARSSDTAPFAPGTLDELAGRRGLLHPDRLPRGAAAVGLAYGALDTRDAQLAALLDRSVVDVLIDTVGGDHFRDYSSLAEPVFAALRRLSGLDLQATAVAWAGWWRQERDKFQARRPLTHVAETDLPFAYVRFDAVGSDGRRRKVTFRSEDGSPQVGEYALERDAFKALIDSLGAVGLFEADAPGEPRADEHVLITLGVMNQKRGMVVPADDDRHALMRMRMDSLEEANLWQRYRDVDRWPNAADWWEAQAKQMEEADPETRVALIKAAIVYAFDDLPDDAARSDALDRLEDLHREDEVAGALTAVEVRTLVHAATSAVAFGAVEERAVEYAIAQGTAHEVRSELVEALADRSEAAGSRLLAELLAKGGADEIREAFADPRPGLRAAAAEAAKTLLQESEWMEPTEKAALADRLRPGLEVLMRDDLPLVAIRAVVALQRMGDLGGVARLEAIYRAGDLGTKAAVAEALGDMPAEEAWPFFSLILGEERDPQSGMVRAAALRGLAQTKHAQAVGLLVFYLLSDPNRSVRVAAAQALADDGGEEPRYAVIKALTEGQPDPEKRARLVDVLGRFRGAGVRDVLMSYLEDPNRAVAQVAALRLADHNEASTVPYLIDILRGNSATLAQAALRALENVTCVRFDASGHELQAEQYERWYQTARITAAGQPDRVWFQKALRRRGYDVSHLGAYVVGQEGPDGVPVLIRALRDDQAVIRRGAAIALQRITGLSMGEVTRSTSHRDSIEVADKWARWWERVQGPKKEDR